MIEGVLILALSGVTLTPTPALAEGPDEVAQLVSFLESFVARFRFAGGLREDAARLAAIDDCVDEMLFIARPFARSRLRTATEISKEIAFDVSEAVLAIRASGDDRRLVPLRGPPRRFVTDAGDELEITVRREGEKLILRTASDRGAEERVLTLSPDGRRLTIDVTILAPRLPLPVRYRLSYLKVPPRQPPTLSADSPPAP